LLHSFLHHSYFAYYYVKRCAALRRRASNDPTGWFTLVICLSRTSSCGQYNFSFDTDTGRARPHGSVKNPFGRSIRPDDGRGRREGDRSYRARDTSNRGFRHFSDKTALCSSSSLSPPRIILRIRHARSHDAIEVTIDILQRRNPSKIICAA